MNPIPITNVDRHPKDDGRSKITAKASGKFEIHADRAVNFRFRLKAGGVVVVMASYLSFRDRDPRGLPIHSARIWHYVRQEFEKSPSELRARAEVAPVAVAHRGAAPSIVCSTVSI
jgi:hypothetical protein